MIEEYIIPNIPVFDDEFVLNTGDIEEKVRENEKNALFNKFLESIIFNKNPCKFYPNLLTTY